MMVTTLLRQGKRCAAVNGGANRDRTGDLLNAIQALSQLSYSPIRAYRELVVAPTTN